MSAAVISDPDAVPRSLARRAVELSHDPQVSLSEGAQHLARLAKGRSLPLERALAALRRDELPDTECEHACILLRHAMGEVAKPPMFGGSRIDA